MGMFMSFFLRKFLLPMLLITGSNSITSSTGLGYLGKCRDGYDGNPCLDNGCKDDGECVQGTPGSIHGFYPQGMEGSAGITCGCNPKSKLIIGLITLLFTSASFVVYKRYKKLEENELTERHGDQLNELNERHAQKLNQLNERHAEQLNQLNERHAEQKSKFEKAYAEQQNKLKERDAAYAEQKDKFEKAYAEQQNKLKERDAAYADLKDKFEKAVAEQELNKIEKLSHPPCWVSIGQQMLSWLLNNESLFTSIIELLELNVPFAKTFCGLLKSVHGTVNKHRKIDNITQ